MSAQIPLPLRFERDQQFDAFHGQQPLRQLLQEVARGDCADWLYLAGPSGSGKTHLLLAACDFARRGGENVMYLPLSSLAGRLGEALAGRTASLVCVDELDAIAGHRDDELALFHFHNAQRQAGSRLVYAAMAMPSSLGLTLPDLVSRLEQCTRLVVQPLDEDDRREVLRQRATRRGLQLDEAVLDYLFRRVGRDLPTLTALLDRLDRASLAQQRRITVPFLRSVLEQA